MDLFVEIENVFQLKNYCRLCALYCDDINLVQISSYHVITSSTNSNTVDAADFIEKSLDIRINHDPSLPKQICQNCLDVLISFFQFKIKCHDAEVMLRSIINDVPFEKKNSFLFEENVFSENLDPFHDDVLNVDVMTDIANTELMVDTDVIKTEEIHINETIPEKLPADENTFICLDCREVAIKNNAM